MSNQFHRLIGRIVVVAMVYSGIHLVMVHALTIGYAQPSDVEGYVLTPDWGKWLNVTPLIALAIAAILQFCITEKKDGGH